MLGIVSFTNELKGGVKECIERIREEVHLEQKMITGDNIFTAVKTAFLAGMVSSSEKIVICQGNPGDRIKAVEIQFLG